MLATQIIFVYQGDEKNKLSEFADWLNNTARELNSRDFARLLEMYFNHSHLLFNQIISKLKVVDDIYLPISEAERLRDLLADLLVRRKMSYESIPGRLAAPLLKDIYSYNTKMKTKDGKVNFLF